MKILTPHIKYKRYLILIECDGCQVVLPNEPNNTLDAAETVEDCKKIIDMWYKMEQL